MKHLPVHALMFLKITKPIILQTGLLLACLAACATPLPSPPVTKTADILSVAALQTALGRNGFGAGFVDGKDGPRTYNAFRDYRKATGLSDRRAREALLSNNIPATLTYTLTQSDLSRVGSAPTDWQAASEVHSMAFESLDEALSEKFHVSKPFLQRLNPGITNWDSELLGVQITVPNSQSDLTPLSAARIEVDCTAYRLRVFGTDDNLLASFPCSIARDQARVPTGELCIASFAPNPNYTFDPANFPESARAREIGRKLILPPGPNNPVGVYWITLNAPGFGIHGTPHPETIGRRESHGCFRLTNWDIVTLAAMVQVGTPVLIVGVPAPAPPPPE
jgi:lipoprotein-anchoring transpeptidase ErfK/SrfK